MISPFSEFKQIYSFELIGSILFEGSLAEGDDAFRTMVGVEDETVLFLGSLLTLLSPFPLWLIRVGLLTMEVTQRLGLVGFLSWDVSH